MPFFVSRSGLHYENLPTCGYRPPVLEPWVVLGSLSFPQAWTGIKFYSDAQIVTLGTISAYSAPEQGTRSHLRMHSAIKRRRSFPALHQPTRLISRSTSCTRRNVHPSSLSSCRTGLRGARRLRRTEPFLDGRSSPHTSMPASPADSPVVAVHLRHRRTRLRRTG